jgi:hypothetical protein
MTLIVSKTIGHRRGLKRGSQYCDCHLMTLKDKIFISALCPLWQILSYQKTDVLSKMPPVMVQAGALPVLIIFGSKAASPRAVAFFF